MAIIVGVVGLNAAYAYKKYKHTQEQLIQYFNSKYLHSTSVPFGVLYIAKQPGWFKKSNVYEFVCPETLSEAEKLNKVYTITNTTQPVQDIISDIRNTPSAEMFRQSCMQSICDGKADQQKVDCSLWPGVFAGFHCMKFMPAGQVVYTEVEFCRMFKTGASSTYKINGSGTYKVN